jgi:hypothetical protein
MGLDEITAVFSQALSESASHHADASEQRTIAEEMVQTKVSLGVLI